MTILFFVKKDYTAVEAVFALSSLLIYHVSKDLEDPAFECMWVWLRPFRLSRQLSGLIFCVVYCPPDTPSEEQKDLMAYIIDKLGVVRSAHPGCGIVVLGDFGKLVVCDLLAQHNVNQASSVRSNTE